MAVRLIDGGNDNDQFVISNAVKGDGPIGCKGGDGTGCFPIEGRDNDFPISNYELGPYRALLYQGDLLQALQAARVMVGSYRH